jgi:hypothetical protein
MLETAANLSVSPHQKTDRRFSEGCVKPQITRTSCPASLGMTSWCFRSLVSLIGDFVWKLNLML